MRNRAPAVRSKANVALHGTQRQTRVNQIKRRQSAATLRQCNVYRVFANTQVLKNAIANSVLFWRLTKLERTRRAIQK